jgi:hypothetical protein
VGLPFMGMKKRGRKNRVYNVDKFSPKQHNFYVIFADRFHPSSYNAENEVKIV